MSEHVNQILERVRKVGVMPVISLPEAKDAAPLAAALMCGGLPIAEVSFRTGATLAGIAAMRAEHPDMLVGAGTVLTKAQAREAVQAGAQFVVCPGLDPCLVDLCLELGVPVMPGICTASELTVAVNKGLGAVKFFPAEPMGGLKTLKALAGPFQNVEFMPTGGVGPGNMGTYLAWERILAVGGSWMVAKNLVAEGRFDEVEALAREAVDLAREARGA